MKVAFFLFKSYNEEAKGRCSSTLVEVVYKSALPLFFFFLVSILFLLSILCIVLSLYFVVHFFSFTAFTQSVHVLASVLMNTHKKKEKREKAYSFS